jgi:hypothetical protein
MLTNQLKRKKRKYEESRNEERKGPEFALDDHKHMRTYGLFKPLMPTGTYTYHLM